MVAVSFVVIFPRKRHIPGLFSSIIAAVDFSFNLLSLSGAQITLVCVWCAGQYSLHLSLSLSLSLSLLSFFVDGDISLSRGQTRLISVLVLSSLVVSSAPAQSSSKVLFAAVLAISPCQPHHTALHLASTRRSRRKTRCSRRSTPRGRFLRPITW